MNSIHFFIAKHKHLKTTSTLITHWLPLIVWLLVIFIVSSIHGSKFQVLPFNTITQIHLEELLSYRQAAFHTLEYGLLAILTYRLLRLKLNHPNNFIYLVSFTSSILYAISDEVHQYFVPGRFATLTDLIFDTLGIIIGLFSIKIFHLIIKKRDSF